MTPTFSRLCTGTPNHRKTGCAGTFHATVYERWGGCQTPWRARSSARGRDAGGLQRSGERRGGFADPGFRGDERVLVLDSDGAGRSVGGQGGHESVPPGLVFAAAHHGEVPWHLLR